LRCSAVFRSDGFERVLLCSILLCSALCGLTTSDVCPQQALLSLSGNLSVSLLVAETVCAENDEEYKGTREYLRQFKINIWAVKILVING